MQIQIQNTKTNLKSIKYKFKNTSPAHLCSPGCTKIQCSMMHFWCIELLQIWCISCWCRISSITCWQNIDKCLMMYNYVHLVYYPCKVWSYGSLHSRAVLAQMYQLWDTLNQFYLFAHFTLIAMHCHKLFKDDWRKVFTKYQLTIQHVWM